jgi:hypothetical protein
MRGPGGRSGRPRSQHQGRYSITHAPLVVKDKVIVGVGGGEYGIRGFIAAYDAATGQGGVALLHDSRPGEPGSETWQACPKGANTFCDPDAWEAWRRIDLDDRLVRSADST